MVHKYRKKTNQGSWSTEIMDKAIRECKAGESIKATAEKYGLPYATLYRHVKTGNASKKLGRFRPVFDQSQENELIAYLKEMDEVFFGLTRDDLRDLAYNYAEKNSLKYPTSWDKHKKAGCDWLDGFLSRHTDITLRSPEPTSIARAKGFNRTAVSRFYENLETQIEKHNIDAGRLYNMDETGISTTSNKPPKVLSTKGKKQVGVVSSAERGQLTTVIGCCNAAGSFLPPFLIFARKKMQPRLLDGAPPGTQGTCTPNGWTTGEVFLNWMQFFVEQVRPTAEKKVLLLLDNHLSHKYYPALDYASKNNIIIVSFAPHTTHKMQPMDVACYGPLKRYFEREISTFQKTHPGRIVNQYDVARLLAPAYLKSSVAINAVHGFERPGIWPVNRHAFGEEEYEPAAVIAGTSGLNARAHIMPQVIAELDIAVPSVNDCSREKRQDSSNAERPAEFPRTRTPLAILPDVGSVRNSPISPSLLDLDFAEDTIAAFANTSDSDDDALMTIAHSKRGIDEIEDLDNLTADIGDVTAARTMTPETDCSTDSEPKGANTGDVAAAHSVALQVVNSSDSQPKVVDVEDRTARSVTPRPDCLTNSEPETAEIEGMIISRPVTPRPGCSKTITVASSLTKNTRRSPSPQPSTSKAHYSPFALRPIPTPRQPMTTRKRTLQKSEVLTSTPLKTEQKQLYEKNKLKKVTKKLDDKPKTGTKTTKPPKSKIAKKTTKTAKATSKKKIEKFKDIVCPFCSEIYIEEGGQPTENWIRCDICHQWCHEDCTAYEGNAKFTCDNCS